MEAGGSQIRAFSSQALNSQGDTKLIFAIVSVFGLPCHQHSTHLTWDGAGVDVGKISSTHNIQFRMKVSSLLEKCH